jgi:Tol biopolymer transport system component/predicted Ser/Thr protein kinase
VIGETISHYKILSRLGAGGMGVVYEAEDTRLGRKVAIKFLPDELNADPEAVQRFLREARVVSSLNHPHICTLYDVGPAFLVMELIEGETLAWHIEKGRMPMERVLRYGGQIADALSAAHAEGITHRDLKPGNIVVSKSGIKVLDFGLARFAPGRDPAMTQSDTATGSRSITGTPAYMAPEQLEGGECDARTDIFALGLVLYEMGTGKKAFTAKSQAGLIAEIMRCEPVLTDLAPPHFGHIVRRCLAKDPEVRWQTARDVKLELDYLREAPPAARTAGQKRRLSPGGWALIAAAAVGLAALGLFLAVPRGREDALSAVPLTSYPGLAMHPSLSPGGDMVAFTWNGEREDNFDVWVKPIGPGNALRLTESPEDEVMSRWSPDGKWIAFLRRKPKSTEAEVFIVPPHTGLEKKVGEAELDRNINNRFLSGAVDCLDWSPDGKWLLVARRPSPGQPAGLALIPVEGGEPRQLTSPDTSLWDYYGAFAPDGHAVAFFRRGAEVQPSLMLLPLTDSLQPREAPTEIGTEFGGLARTFAWTSDSRELIVSSGWPPESAKLWRMPGSGKGAARPMGLDGAEPVVSRDGNRLVFSRHTVEWNIWSLNLDQAGRVVGPAVKAFDSSKNELTPRFSRDGSKVAFGSNRSGFYEIWVCRNNGSDCDPLTNMRTYAGSPDWSPDETSIVFDRVSHVLVVSSAGGPPRQLSRGIAPRWSVTDWIYFPRDAKVWRISPSGGAPEIVSSDGGSDLAESPDGKWLYISRGNRLYRMPSSGGEQTLVLPAVAGRAFEVVEHGIWYFTPITAEGSALEYYDFNTKIKRPVFRTSRPILAGITISPLRDRILFTQTDRDPSRDLMLVDGFR